MKSALVIGGSSSVGEAIVQRLCQGGDRIVATYHQHRPQSNEKYLSWTKLDLTDLRSIDEFVSSAMPTLGGLDLAVFLSGALPGKALADYEDSEIDRVVAVNLSGQMKLLRKLLLYFNQGSQVLMLSSISAQRGSYDPVYAASKAGILGLVKSLATQLAPRVRVNAIAPGLVEHSTMFNEMAPERRRLHLAQTPVGRLLIREQLAEVVHDLAQEHWSHLNGACIDLNGGQHVR